MVKSYDEIKKFTVVLPDTTKLFKLAVALHMNESSNN